MTIFKNFKNQSQRFTAIFRNFKNQSQRFMTIFRNFKNQSQRFTIGIKTLRYFRVRSSALESKKCLKEKITVEEVIFFTILEVKS